ncbi:MAG: DUF6448 family protein [candidate division Zixibacteria bacterium]
MFKIIRILMLLFVIVITTSIAAAHCDSMSGPVIVTARTALERGDVTPVLKWVKAENETEIRELFEKTLAVRQKGPEAKELADMYFFETLVRIHRAGEGAPYTGLKPAGEIEPIIQLSDKALESGDVDSLILKVSEKVSRGIRERFEHASNAEKNAGISIEAGREFVEAYVVFTHYVEKIHEAAAGHDPHADH